MIGTLPWKAPSPQLARPPLINNPMDKAQVPLLALMIDLLRRILTVTQIL